MLSPADDPVHTDATAASNVVELRFGRKTTDGGRARIMSRRSTIVTQPVDTAPSEYKAPASGPV
jgi:hypothetical protein